MRGPQATPGFRDYLVRGYHALSWKWLAISIVLTALLLVLLGFNAADTSSYETALQSQASRGDWAGGLQSLFVLRMLASPRPLEFLVLIIASPVIWNALPSGWRIMIFPVIAQLLYYLVSQVAVLPLEFALLNLFSSVTSSLSSLLP